MPGEPVKRPLNPPSPARAGKKPFLSLADFPALSLLTPSVLGLSLKERKKKKHTHTQ
jgi:hypothetical protein